MIRLGSLAGYPFEGPRVLAGFTAPPSSAVFVILYRPNPESKPEEYGVLFVGQSDLLDGERLPFGHDAAPCWLKRVGGHRFDLHIATYDAPGSTRSHREQMVKELIAVYRPGCNSERYDQAWEEHWIGAYQAPTTKPLTTRRDPSSADD